MFPNSNNNNDSNNNHHPPSLNLPLLVNAYKDLCGGEGGGKKRMFFLDYDGTLSPIVSKPEDAYPSDELKILLGQLASDENNCIYIISGRDRKTLGNWLGDLHVGMSAEHGCFLRSVASKTEGGTQSGTSQWRDLVQEEGFDVRWKEEVSRIFYNYAKMLPGAVVECKEYAVTFHYRMCEKQASKPVVQQLRKELQGVIPHYSTLQFIKGKKSLEARINGITKGVIIRRILDVDNRENVGFIFCAGDDLTDEDMFTELENDTNLPRDCVFTCTVNFRGSKAWATVENSKQILAALHELAESKHDASTGDNIDGNN